MKKSFVCSLICRHGIVGGGLYLDDCSIAYKTNKLTVDKEYKHLVLPLAEICDLTWKWVVFPVAKIRLNSGKEYKFIIFNKKRFEKYYTEVKQL